MAIAYARPDLPDGYVEKMDSIARRLANLSPDYSNPHRFYRRRDDLVDELVRMVRR